MMCSKPPYVLLCLWYGPWVRNKINIIINLREAIAMERILGFRNWKKRSGFMSAVATPHALHWFLSIAFKDPPTKKVAGSCFIRKSCPKMKSAHSSCTTPIFSSYQWLNAFIGTRTKPRTYADDPTSVIRYNSPWNFTLNSLTSSSRM